MAKTYTAEHHKQAFEIWYESRNWTRVSQELKSEWATAKRWAEPDFECKWNCPWHNWAVLIEEHDKAQQTRNALLENGVTDPVVHDQAMRDVLLGQDVEVSQEQRAALNLIRTDAERISHWEYLWSKVYFDATGIVLDWRQMRGVDITDPAVEAEMRDTLRVGLHATSLDQCVKMLKIIQEQVEVLRGAEAKAPAKAMIEEVEDLSIVELRRMRKMLKHTPPSKLKTMITVADSEDDRPETAAG